MQSTNRTPKKFVKPSPPKRTPFADLTNALQSTPRKSVSGTCFICGKSPSGQLRSLYPNLALRDCASTFSVIQECFLIVTDSGIKDSLNLVKICLSCKGRVSKAAALKSEIVRGFDKLEKSKRDVSGVLDNSLDCVPLTSTPRNDDRSKRMLPTDLTPSPVKKPPKRSFKSSLDFNTSEESNKGSDHSYSRSQSVLDETASTRKQSFLSLQNFFVPQPLPDNEVARLKEILKNPSLSTKSFAVVIAQECPTLQQSIQSALVNEINITANHLCTLTVEPGPSVLRNLSDVKSLTERDVLSEALLELKRTMPFVFEVLMALSNPPDSEKPYSHYCVATMYSMAMHSRNNQLCAVQKLNTATAVRMHCNNDLLSIFHKIGITLAVGTKLHFLNDLGEFNTSGMIASIRKGTPGKLTMDNIDGMMMARQVRLGSGNKHYHYTASTYYPDRIDVLHLSMEQPPLPNLVPQEIFYLNKEEKTVMLKNYGYLVGRMLVRFCPELNWMEKCVPKNIPHEYSEAMARKSEVFPLKIILQDPKYLNDCIRALGELTSLLKTSYDKAGRIDEFSCIFVPLGGDQLVRVRARGARDLRAGAHNREERLETTYPEVVEFFHVQQDFLEKMVKTLYNPKSSRDVGTLPYYKVLLQRTNVNGKVKGKYQAHDDFVKTVGTGLVLTLALKVLKMENPEDSPGVDYIPDNISRMHTKNRQPIFCRIVNDIVGEIFSSYTPASNKPVNFELHIPGKGNIMFQVDGDELQRYGEMTVGIPSFGNNIRLTTSSLPKDDVRNYNTQFLQQFLHSEEFRDAIKEGDMVRTSSCLKHMLPFFFAHSHRSKYFIEIVDFILKTELLLPPALALRCRLGSFVNPHGGAGNNKPADMQQENNILVLKDVIRGLGANKTEKALVRSSQAAPVANTIVDNYKNVLGVRHVDGHHTNKSDTDDVNEVIKRAKSFSPFEPVARRTLVHYKDCRSSAFAKIDKLSYAKHLTTVVNGLKRGLAVDDLYDDKE